MTSATVSDERTETHGEIAPAFIVGMPRAASRWLCRCLNAHPDAAAFGETLFWGRRYVAPESDGRYSPDQLHRAIDHLRSGFCVTRYSDDAPGSLRHVRDETFSDLLDVAFADVGERLTPGETFHRIISAIAHAEGARLVVEKTPHHLNWIDRIVAVMPTARFIILTREPYSFMLSYKHQGDRMRASVRKGFQRRYHPLAAAVVWRGSMISALAAQRHLPEQTHVVAHEDLREHPADVLAGVQRFLGLEVQPLADRVPPVNTSFPKGDRPELGADDVFWMNRIAGRTMRAAGYSLRPTPKRPRPILRSILMLPIWAVWNLLSMRRIVDGSIIAYFWRWLRPARIADATGKSKQTTVTDAK